MKNIDVPSLENHEIRIYKLEQSNEDIQKNIKELKDSVLVNQAQSAERSKIMISQNESLMKQNERLSEQKIGRASCRERVF